MQRSPTASGSAGPEWTSVMLSDALDQVGPTVDGLRIWLQTRGAADTEALDGVTLAATEALTNAIRHGAKAATESPRVRLAWTWRDHELELEVSEPGCFAPADNWRDLPEDSLAESGRGGFLITRLMDAVEHQNASGRHALRMRKRLDHASADAFTQAPRFGRDSNAAVSSESFMGLLR